jgi:hypothetical protein
MLYDAAAADEFTPWEAVLVIAWLGNPSEKGTAHIENARQRSGSGGRGRRH